MDSLIDDILYKVNEYLLLNDKIKLSKVNNGFRKIGKKVICFHIGEIIGNFLGINLESIDNDIEIIRQIPLEIIKEIINCLDTTTNNKKIRRYYNLPIGIIFRIYKSNRDECINKLKTKNIFRTYGKPRKIVSNPNNIIRKKFPNVYSMID